MSWQVECATCKRKDLDLMRCAGCHEVYYCSRECQRKHWTVDHRAKCEGRMKKGRNKQIDLMPEVKIKKEKDTKTDILEKPTIRDQHTIETKKEKEGAACEKCGGDTSFKVCAKCRMVFYCSRECQKQDWRRHKKDCSLMVDAGFQDFTAFLRLTEMYRKKPKSIKTFKEAMSVASNLFHERWKLIDDLREVSMESAVNVNIQNKIFVGYIHRMHPLKYHQHGFYIKDKRGGQTIVLFYLENDDPTPYFQWDDLHPGRFICIICPIFRCLLDKWTGFKIRHPSEIRLLKL